MRPGQILKNVQRLHPFNVPTLKRTHNLGELKRTDIGKEVVLTGWLARFRSRKDDRAFVDIRDSSGKIQLVVQELPERLAQARCFDYRKISEALSFVPFESVIAVRGHLEERQFIAKKPDSQNGDIEVFVESFEVLNHAKIDLPFYPSHSASELRLPNAELRAEHRYLDLRHPTLSRNIRLRSQVAQAMRQTLLDEEFVEVETPMLLRSSPEGAREFLVPARTHGASNSLPQAPLELSGAAQSVLSASLPNRSIVTEEPRFYALAQSPQQPKQLLIASGCVDKYFQFARCFRDEDGRKDRQPEFTQVDLERAFVSWRPDVDSLKRGWRIGGMEIRGSVENLIRNAWSNALGVKLLTPFETMTYQEAMSRYGSDKPDTRFSYEIQPLQQLIRIPNFADWMLPGHFVDCLVIRANDTPAQKAVKELNLIRQPGAGIEARYLWENELLWNSVPTLVKATHRPLPKLEFDLHPGDVIFMNLRNGSFQGGSTALGDLRLRIIRQAQEHGLEEPKEPHFLWVTEFPLFTRADSDKEFLAHGRWSSSHHPFTAPTWEDVEQLIAGNFGVVRGQHYDLVLNGMEIGGGSVRIHDATLQEFVFKEVLQLNANECKPFETLLQALRSGAPPHGGIALGFDRIMAIICGASSIKDVIAFPKSLGGADPLFKSPSTITDQVLEWYGLRKTQREDLL